MDEMLRSGRNGGATANLRSIIGQTRPARLRRLAQKPWRRSLHGGLFTWLSAHRYHRQRVHRNVRAKEFFLLNLYFLQDPCSSHWSTGS